MQTALTSDLVRDSKLRTTITNDTTRHVIEVAGHNARQRKIRHEQQWKRVKRLGEGAYGEVWLEKLIAGESQVEERAVKIIRKRREKSMIVDYSREIEAIAKFSHPRYNSCFVESFGWFESDRYVFITMEYFPHGDLQKYLISPLPETEVQQITFQILEGLRFMHNNDFAHRDLKPSNIFVKSHGPEWWVKIGDFGISKRAEEGMTALRTFSGTLGFLAPEILIQNGFLDTEGFGEVLKEYTHAVDLWSLGEIVFRALTNEPPFPRGLASYVKGTSVFPEHILRTHKVTNDGCNLVKELLKPTPDNRPTSEQALKHPWIASQKESSPKASGETQRSQLVEFFDAQPELFDAAETARHDQPLSIASATWSTIQSSGGQDDEVIQREGGSPRSEAPEKKIAKALAELQRGYLSTVSRAIDSKVAKSRETAARNPSIHDKASPEAESQLSYMSAVSGLIDSKVAKGRETTARNPSIHDQASPEGPHEYFRTMFGRKWTDLGDK